MYYSNEFAFANEFISCLVLLGVKNIPFANQDFYDGVEKMAEYFTKNESKFGEAADKLSMLFNINPYECVYSRFRGLISERNGHGLSFVNPEYVISNTTWSQKGAEVHLNAHKSGLQREDIENMTKAFCEGAKIACQYS